MADAGIFSEEQRIELLEGEVVKMTPIGHRHAACVDRLTRLLVLGSGDAAIVRVQSPVQLSDLSELQPDLVLLRPVDDFYASAHPRSEDVLLVIEVAETTASYDRDIKLPLYARAGLPAVWIVDLPRSAVDVYSDPRDQEYTQRTTYGRGDLLRAELPKLELCIDELLP
jgi:Uma2 family endonuclease